MDVVKKEKCGTTRNKRTSCFSYFQDKWVIVSYVGALLEFCVMFFALVLLAKIYHNLDEGKEFDWAKVEGERWWKSKLASEIGLVWWLMHFVVWVKLLYGLQMELADHLYPHFASQLMFTLFATFMMISEPNFKGILALTNLFNVAFLGIQAKCYFLFKSNRNSVIDEELET